MTTYLIKVDREHDDNADELVVPYELRDQAALDHLIDVTTKHEWEEARGYQCVLKAAKAERFPCLLVAKKAYFHPLRWRGSRWKLANDADERKSEELLVDVWRTESFMIFYDYADMSTLLRDQTPPLEPIS